MSSHKHIELIGYRCGLGAGIHECAKGPDTLKKSTYLKPLGKYLHWQASLAPTDNQNGLNALNQLVKINTELAQTSAAMVAEEKFFITIGGDHSSAIGTWSGVATALIPLSLGLIWIDAHLDSHTEGTTPSGNIHGMPLAALLGHGNKKLTEILTKNPKLLPQNVCVIGARSFESGEHELLKKLKVRIFYMDEIKERGLDVILKEAHDIVSKNTQFYGISLDLDAIDPKEAPGVGTPEENGISKTELLSGFDIFLHDHKLIAAEIAEFNPDKDVDHRTEILIAKILEKFSGMAEKNL